MTNYDKLFIQNLNDILTNGSEYLSRAVWEETNEQAKCIKLFGIVNRYNTKYENEAPVGTIRKFPIKNCIDELLWIWQRKSNNINDLKSHVWDSWADENGSIGAAYGFQVRSKLRKASHTDKIYKNNSTNQYIHAVKQLYLDQTDFVIHELKYNTDSRRIITDLYSVDQTGLMGLDPCCYSCTWNVTYKDEKPYLNLLLNKRSQDMVVANNWYDKHIPIAQHLIEISEQAKQFQIPKVNIPKKSFYDYDIDDFVLENYNFVENIKNIPVAI